MELSPEQQARWSATSRAERVAYTLVLVAVIIVAAGWWAWSVRNQGPDQYCRNDGGTRVVHANGVNGTGYAQCADGVTVNIP